MSAGNTDCGGQTGKGARPIGKARKAPGLSAGSWRGGGTSKNSADTPCAPAWRH